MNSHLYTSDEGVETLLSSLPGTILDGGYEIQGLLRSEPDASIFSVRILGDRYTRAEVMFLYLNERDAAAQIECWKSAKALRSPYFNAPISFGTRRLAEDTVPYVVVVKADETLAEVTRERPLEAEEALETMLSAARALVDLHSRGLVHGFVTPEHILSIGQDIKLSGHTARPASSNPQPYSSKPAHVAPEGLGCNSTPAADMWCLGASLIEVLHQKVCEDKSPEQLESLPNRLVYIAKRCLETDVSSRATAPQVLDMLEGRVAVEAPKVAPLAAAAVAASSTVSLPRVETAPVPETITKVSPPSTVTPSTRVSDRVEESQVDDLNLSESGTERRPIWLYVGGGLLLIVLVLWLAWPRHSVPARTEQVAATVPSMPTTPVPQQLPPAPADPKAAEFSKAKTSSSAASQVPVSGEHIWRVVVYTYNRREDAEEMANSINHGHPELDAKVFVPSGHSVSYLVTVGEPMNREEAVRYQSLAVGSGMPRDTYIQNFHSE